LADTAGARMGRGRAVVVRCAGTSAARHPIQMGGSAVVQPGEHSYPYSASEEESGMRTNKVSPTSPVVLTCGLAVKHAICKPGAVANRLASSVQQLR
jgi:hypothetical protein